MLYNSISTTAPGFMNIKPYLKSMGQNHSYRICCEGEITTSNNHFYILGHFSLPFPLKFLRLVYTAWLSFPDFGSISHLLWSDYRCCHSFQSSVKYHWWPQQKTRDPLLWPHSEVLPQNSAAIQLIVTQQQFSSWISKWVNPAQPFWNIWHCYAPFLQSFPPLAFGIWLLPSFSILSVIVLSQSPSRPFVVLPAPKWGC